MKYLFLVMVSIMIMGCSQKVEHTSFSSDIVNKYALDDFDMKNIQFFVSNDIILYKEKAVDASSVIDGKLVVNQSQHSNVIKIEAGTPCVVVCSSSHQIKVSFDNGIELTFLNPHKKCCKKNTKYYLAANKVKNGVATVDILGETYIVQQKSAFAYLTIEKEYFEESDKNSLIAEGRVVGEFNN